MIPEKWQTIIGDIKDKFKVEEEGEESYDEEGGIKISFIIFEGPLGKMRLEHIEKPAILDKKTTYSNRIGSDTKVDYVYSETDKSYSFNAYKWDDSDEEWVEIEANNFG